MGRLDGKVAVVTGGANGIGRACCERFAAEGADIVFGDVSDDAAAETASALDAAGRKAVYAHTDVLDPQAVDALIRAAIDTLGRIDAVVTAAGVSYASYQSVADARKSLAQALADPENERDELKRFTEMPLSSWQRVLDINLTGTYTAVQAAAKRMLAAGTRGSIVTIASIAAKRADLGPLAYAVSKAGVWMLTKHIARTLGPAGIRVNSIGPGWIETNMTVINQSFPEAAAAVNASIPLGRMAKPVEVANTALFLASDESSYLTGELIHVDGGILTD